MSKEKEEAKSHDPTQSKRRARAPRKGCVYKLLWAVGRESGATKQAPLVLLRNLPTTYEGGHRGRDYYARTRYDHKKGNKQTPRTRRHSFCRIVPFLLFELLDIFLALLWGFVGGGKKKVGNRNTHAQGKEAMHLA
nr:hypothetical protein [Pandoravirus massiliensis]